MQPPPSTPPEPPPPPSPPPSEVRVALIEFYGDTQGENWTHLDGWFRGELCVDSWQGVTCCPAMEPTFVHDEGMCYGTDPLIDGTPAFSNASSGGHVVSLSLASNNLAGQVGASICAMPRLSSLDLSENALRGPLPACLASMPLTYLGLEGNAFDYPEDDMSLVPLVQRCKADPTFVCAGLPPDSCSAFGPEYRPRTDDPTQCTRCPDPTGPRCSRRSSSNCSPNFMRRTRTSLDYAKSESME